MTVKTITYARLFNTGNYNNERLELTVELVEGDDPHQAIEELKAIVARSFEGEKEPEPPFGEDDLIL